MNKEKKKAMREAAEAAKAEAAKAEATETTEADVAKVDAAEATEADAAKAEVAEATEADAAKAEVAEATEADVAKVDETGLGKLDEIAKLMSNGFARMSENIGEVKKDLSDLAERVNTLESEEFIEIDDEEPWDDDDYSTPPHRTVAPEPEPEPEKASAEEAALRRGYAYKFRIGSTNTYGYTHDLSAAKALDGAWEQVPAMLNPDGTINHLMSRQEVMNYFGWKA